MSQLKEIQAAQRSLEDVFVKRMGELEARIQSSGPAKDTVAKVAEEFRAFREIVFNMLGILRKQISECTKMYDDMETRNRRKTLIFSGIAEASNKDCSVVIADVLSSKLAAKDVAPVSIKACYRLGNSNKNQPRPMSVRFRDVDTRNLVWKSKTAFKGTSISVKEFLTKPRQAVFGRARLHFGMRACWSQNGIIIIKTPDSAGSKITSMEELDSLMTRFPKGVEGSASGTLSGAGISAVTTGANTKNITRKN